MGRSSTSCEECQRQRLGCNAIQQPGRACYNCVRRGATCSMTSRKSTTRGRARVRVDRREHLPQSEASTELIEQIAGSGRDSDTFEIGDDASPALQPFSPSYATPVSLSKSSDSLAKCQQVWRLHRLLWNVYTTILEPRIGLSVGGSGCPFTANNPVRLLVISVVPN